MSKLIAATLLGPNDPYWPFCKRNASEWAAKHIVLEDHAGEAWGNEAQWRKRLWDMALESCTDSDWAFILDSDFVVAGDPRLLVEATGVAEWRFSLCDLWECRQEVEAGTPDFIGDDDSYPRTHCYIDKWYYRCGRFWQAHNNPRAWMFRAGSMRDKPWRPERGIHAGHAPPHTGNFGIAPFPVLHLGWMPNVRQAKYERYRSLWPQLLDHEKAHVDSIVADAKLKELPRQFAKYLEGLAPIDKND